MEINLSGKSLQELKQMAQQFPVAGASALNRLARMAKTEISSQIRKTYNIKKKDVDPFIEFPGRERATARRLQAVLRSSGMRIPLGYFGARQTKAGASVAVKKGQRMVIAHSFVATMRFGKKMVYVRTTKARGPVKTLKGPSIAQLFGSRYIRGVIDRLIDSKFPDILRHEISYRLSRANTVSATGDIYGSQGELVKRGEGE
jgi:hypothetical protein